MGYPEAGAVHTGEVLPCQMSSLMGVSDVWKCEALPENSYASRRLLGLGILLNGEKFEGIAELAQSPVLVVRLAPAFFLTRLRLYPPGCFRADRIVSHVGPSGIHAYESIISVASAIVYVSI